LGEKSITAISKASKYFTAPLVILPVISVWAKVTPQGHKKAIEKTTEIIDILVMVLNSLDLISKAFIKIFLQ
jgi:hypothetical protein